jgi:hypothetical protein
MVCGRWRLQIIAFQQVATGGTPEKFYAHLQTVSDGDVTETARGLLRDHWKALDVALA